MKILLPIDTSDACKETIAWAEDFLIKLKADIYLLNVIRYTVFVPEMGMMPYEYEQELSEKLLQTVKSGLESTGFTVVKAESCYGEPAQAICSYADTHGIDQIIIGSRGHSSIADLLMGSVGHDVFKHSKQPTLLIKNTKHHSLNTSYPNSLHLLHSV